MWESWNIFWDKFLNPDYSEFYTEEVKEDFIGPPTISDITGEQTIKDKMYAGVDKLYGTVVAVVVLWVVLDRQPWK